MKSVVLYRNGSFQEFDSKYLKKSEVEKFYFDLSSSFSHYMNAVMEKKDPAPCAFTRDYNFGCVSIDMKEIISVTLDYEKPLE